MKQSKIMKNLLNKLAADNPGIKFKKGDSFYWSPKDSSVTYTPAAANDNSASWSLLHEVSHAILGHAKYSSDFELVQLEVEAWSHAEKLASKYGIDIDPDHIQDCLDTYRDWLHRRSTCPTCRSVSLQIDSKTYRCMNCGSKWHVSNSRFCRPYRRLAATK